MPPKNETMHKPAISCPTTYNITERIKIINESCKSNELARLILHIETKLADDLMALHYGPKGSGSRMWGFIQSHFPDPEHFFIKAFIHNHCPLIYMSESGSNVTPAQMPAPVRKSINLLCDRALADIVRLFPACTALVGIGRFTEARIKSISEEHSLPYQQMYMMHPSPRNPTATKEWPRVAAKAFLDLGLIDGDPSLFALTPENQTVPNLERKRKAKQKVAQPSKKSVRRKLFD